MSDRCECKTGVFPGSFEALTAETRCMNCGKKSGLVDHPMTNTLPVSRAPWSLEALIVTLREEADFIKRGGPSTSLTVDLLNRAAEALSANTIVDGWRDIASAPKDGTKILGFHAGVYIDPDSKDREDVQAYSICWWTPDFYGNATFIDGYNSVGAQWWKPLPNPPVASHRET